jgi:hypothetical protein
MYFYNTEKIVFVLQYDLLTNQYKKNQTGWLITLYKRGPGQVMLFYTSSPLFCINLFYRWPGQIMKLPLLCTSYWNSYHRKDFILISCFVCMCVIFYFITEQTLVFNILSLCNSDKL